jgi:hypothetical protein
MSKRYRLPAIVLALGLAATACTTGSSNPETGFSDDFRAGWMADCTPQVNEDFCSCLLDEMDGVITQEELIQVGVDAYQGNSDETAQVIADAVDQCADQLPSGG